MDERKIIEKNSPEENSPPLKRRGGPTSLEGKAKSSIERTGRLVPVVRGSRERTGRLAPVVRGSSLNRLTHGCRSERTVLPFEDRAQWEFTLESWMTAYDPQAHRPSVGRCARLDEEPTAATLVFETARAQWIFQRNQQRLDETESALPSDAIEWSDEHIKRYNNFLRYKTTAERSFYRAFNNLEAHYKRQSDKTVAIERARAQMGKIQMQWLKQKAAIALTRDLCGLQWVEVSANSSGECVTSYAPTNEQLAEILASRTERAEKENTPRPQFVTRYVHFVAGVPPAYDWLHPNDIQRYRSCTGVQHFTYEDWLLQIEAEKQAATGHLQPFTTGVLME
jgi:hypothetical protein